MLPDFNTWYAEQRFKPGTRVRIIAPGSAFHGRETTVTRYDRRQRLVWIVSFVPWTNEQNGRPESFEVINDPS